MSIEQHGFLSPDIERTRSANRARYSTEFALITEVNALAQSAIPGFSVLQRSKKNLYACAYYIRALQSLQASVLLAEMALLSEANTLIRSGLETVFYLGAVIRSDSNRDLVRDNVKRLSTALDRGLKAMPGALPAAQAAELDAALQSMLPPGETSAPVAIEAFAAKAELSHLYDTLYRQLSAGHAHPSLLSLNSIWQLTEDHQMTGVNWGPDRHEPEELQAALHIAVVVLLQLMTQWALLLEQNGKVDRRFFESIEKLMAAAIRLSEVGASR